MLLCLPVVEDVPIGLIVVRMRESCPALDPYSLFSAIRYDVRSSLFFAFIATTAMHYVLVMQGDRATRHFGVFHHLCNEEETR